MSPIFRSVGMLQDAMTFHRQRHSVLAGNVANVDTPGYRSVDIERTSVGTSDPNQPASSDSEHIQRAEAGTTDVFVDDGNEPGLDGNTVSLERELAKMDANRVRYSTASELVSRRLAMLRYAGSDGVR